MADFLRCRGELQVLTREFHEFDTTLSSLQLVAKRRGLRRPEGGQTLGFPSPLERAEAGRAELLGAGCDGEIRVGCFKGFDEESFMFNTGAAAADFGRQFEIMRRLLDLGIDVYAYVTLTTGNLEGISDRVARFVDQLQARDANLPLRTVPLEIRVFSPVGPRMNDARRQAIDHQNLAVAAWNAEIARRYTTSLRERSIVDVPLQSRSAA